jgi:hypothetical protein
MKKRKINESKKTVYKKQVSTRKYIKKRKTNEFKKRSIKEAIIKTKIHRQTDNGTKRKIVKKNKPSKKGK